MKKSELTYLGRAHGGSISFFKREEDNKLFFEKIEDGVDRFVGDSDQALHEHFPIIGERKLIYRSYFISAMVSVREGGMIYSQFPISDGKGDFTFIEGNLADLTFAVEKSYIYPEHVRCSAPLMPLMNIVWKGQRK